LHFLKLPLWQSRKKLPDASASGNKAIHAGFSLITRGFTQRPAKSLSINLAQLILD
jgi:hypothetical protein